MVDIGAEKVDITPTHWSEPQQAEFEYLGTY